jgi:5,10-methylenetetrahydrofolate reductase
MSLLEEKLRSTNFVVTTELTPPKGIDLSEFFAKADALKGIVDAINITESPRARMAVEPKSVGHLLQDRGVEAIVQITARDRNRIAIQADLLGGCLLGIGNFVFMAGDDPKNGDHPAAKGVFDLTTIEVLRAARSLRSGRDVLRARGSNGIRARVAITYGVYPGSLAATSRALLAPRSNANPSSSHPVMPPAMSLTTNPSRASFAAARAAPLQ